MANTHTSRQSSAAEAAYRRRWWWPGVLLGALGLSFLAVYAGLDFGMEAPARVRWQNASMTGFAFATTVAAMRRSHLLPALGLAVLATILARVGAAAVNALLS